MKNIYMVAAALASAAVPMTPVLAGWKLVQNQTPVSVGRGTLTVTPSEDWNRSTSGLIKKGEAWTLDGQTLNHLYFVSGLAPGETLFKDVDKKNNPLPKLRKGMDLTEVAEFFESSSRIALKTSVYTVTSVEPAEFAGNPGVRISFEYAVDGSTLVRKGLASATLVNGQLYMAVFSAPAIHYFDRDLPKVEAIMASAHL